MDNWLIVAITLLLSAFFSGMEIAFITSNNLKIEIDKSKGMISAKIMSYFKLNPSRFIGALLLGNNVALVIYGIAMATILEPFFYKLLPSLFSNDFTVLIMQTIVATVLILVAAEFIPKALFRINPNYILNIFAIPVFIFYIVFYPIHYLFIGLGEVILRVFFRTKTTDYPIQFSRLDLDNYIKEFAPESEHTEDIMPPEIQMFQNAIEFKSIKVRECMIPRTDIEAIDEIDSIDNLSDKFINTGFSKIPVYKDSIDNIIAYAHHSDLFKNPKSIKSICRLLNYVPETMLANIVLSNFIKDHKSIAIVVDEFGGTSGIVTMEDIIEEIFGEIEDEHDEEENIEKDFGNGEYIFSGRMEIDYLNEKYKFNFPESEDFETLAGFILENHESIPDKSEEIVIGPYIFTILQASDNRIDQVHLKLGE